MPPTGKMRRAAKAYAAKNNSTDNSGMSIQNFKDNMKGIYEMGKSAVNAITTPTPNPRNRKNIPSPEARKASLEKYKVINEQRQYEKKTKNWTPEAIEYIGNKYGADSVPKKPRETKFTKLK
jgi:hypothetical protein